jgi:hypothetical protein
MLPYLIVLAALSVLGWIVLAVHLAYARVQESKGDLKLLNEFRKEFHDRSFRYLVLLLLGCLSLGALAVLARDPPCGACEEERKEQEALSARHAAAGDPRATGAAGTTTAATQPRPMDPAMLAREMDVILRERESRMRVDSENRAWARTFLTAVAGAVIGFLFGSGIATSGTRSTGSDAGPAGADKGTLGTGGDDRGGGTPVVPVVPIKPTDPGARSVWDRSDSSTGGTPSARLRVKEPDQNTAKPEPDAPAAAPGAASAQSSEPGAAPSAIIADAVGPAGQSEVAGRPFYRTAIPGIHPMPDPRYAPAGRDAFELSPEASDHRDLLLSNHLSEGVGLEEARERMLKDFTAWWEEQASKLTGGQDAGAGEPAPVEEPQRLRM